MQMSQRKLGSYSDFKSGNFFSKEFIFVLNHINQTPSFKSGRGNGMHYPPSYRLLLVDQVFDSATGVMRNIRYIPGEMSIFQDEQTPDDKIPKKNFHLEFIDGDKLVDGRQTLLIKYLMTTNKNGSNPNRDKSVRPAFFTVDPGEGLKSVMDSDELLAEAQHFCYKGDWDEVAAYAMVLGIPLDRDAREIRYSLRMKATADPKRFMEGLRSPKMKRKYYVMEALKEGIIVKNSSTNTINWKDGGAITQAPMGKDLVDDFVDASFSPNGEKVWSAIMGILRPEASLPKVVTELQNVPSDADLNQIKIDVKPVIPQVIIADISDEEVSDFIDRGLKSGAIVFTKPQWHKIDGKNYSRKALAQELKVNPILLAKLKTELSK